MAHQLKTPLSPPQAAGGTAGGSRSGWFLRRAIPICKHKSNFQSWSFSRFRKSFNQSSGHMTSGHMTTRLHKAAANIQLLLWCSAAQHPDRLRLDKSLRKQAAKARTSQPGAGAPLGGWRCVVCSGCRLAGFAPTRLLAAAPLPCSSHRFVNQSSPRQRVCGRLIMPAAALAGAAPQQGRNNKGSLASPWLR